MARRGNPACRGRRARLGGKDNGASRAECARGDYGDDYADTSLNPSPLTYGEAERQAFLLLINELAGAGGFEPPYDGIKIRCLTAWRRPNPPPARKAARRKARRTIVRAPARRNGQRRDIEARRAFSDMGIRLPRAASAGRLGARPRGAARPRRSCPVRSSNACAALAPAATVGRTAPGAPKPSSRRRPVPRSWGAGARGSPPRPEPRSREASAFAVSAPLVAGPSIRQFTQFCQDLIRISRAKCFRRDGIRLYCSLWGQERKHGHDERPPTILRGPAKARRAARRHRARLRSGRLDTGLGRLFRHAVSSDAQDEAGEDNRRIENGAASP